MAFSCLYIALVNMAIDTHIYYLPFYFQAVKSTSASTSGVRLLPYLISVFTTALVSGTLITTLGPYVPFMTFGALILTAGCALIQTLQLHSTEAQWFGYEVLTGIGFGTAFQIPYTAVQVVLSDSDLPIGNALIVFFQALGGALAVSIGQNVLSNTLLKQLQRIPQIDPAAVIKAGATGLSSSSVVAAAGEGDSPAVLELVRKAYGVALQRTYVLPIVAAGVAFCCSLGMENRSVKKKKKESKDDGEGEGKGMGIEGEKKSRKSLSLGRLFQRQKKRESV